MNKLKTKAQIKARLQRCCSLEVPASSDYDLGDRSQMATGAQLNDAGVLIAFAERGDQAHLILTKRAPRMRNHAGQIAFPGGRVDSIDKNITETALREANEEVGLQAKDVDVFGELPAHITVTNYRMRPVLGWIRDDISLVREPEEVSEILFVPAEHVLNLDRYVVQSRHWRGTARGYYTLPYGPYYIWGATARILFQLARRYNDVKD